MKFNNILNNFSSGEWSPKMRARTDTQQYANACAELLNAYPLIQGGAFRRSGFKYIPVEEVFRAKLDDSTKLVAYNTSDGGQHLLCMNSPFIADWFVTDVGFNESVNTLGVVAGTSGVSAFGVPKKMHTTQVGDLIFIVDSEGQAPPAVFYKLGGIFTVKSLRDYVATFGGPTKEWQSYPFREIQAAGSSVNLTPGATTGATTLTASAAFFDAGHVGAIFNLSAAGSTGSVRVTGFTSSTVVSIQVLSTVAATAHGTAAGTSWQESAWSPYRGWPRAITAYQGRLVYGGSNSNSDTIWGSRISNVLDMMERPFEQSPDFAAFPDDNARPFTLVPTSAEAANIRALSSSKTLVINTDKAEIVAYGTNGALGPLDVQFESSTSFGAEAVQPVRLNNFLTYVQRTGKKIRDVVFNFTEDQYKSNDLSFVADHYFNSTNIILYNSQIQEMTATKRDSILWVRPDVTGELFGVTLDRDYSVNGWFKVETQGEFVAIAAAGEKYDDLYVVTKRSNPTLEDKYYLEKLTAVYEFPDQKLTPVGPADTSSYVDNSYIQGPTYLDCWAAQNLFLLGEIPYTPVTVWTGFAHLNGFEVEVIADGNYIGTQVVVDGIINTPEPAQAILVGLKYETVIKTMPIEIGQQVPGTPQGFIKRIDEVTIKFWNTLGAKYGTSEDRLLDIDFKDPQDEMDDLAKFTTSFEKLKVEDSYYEEPQVIIKQDKPWPCNVLAIISRGVLYD